MKNYSFPDTKQNRKILGACGCEYEARPNNKIYAKLSHSSRCWVSSEIIRLKDHKFD